MTLVMARSTLPVTSSELAEDHVEHAFRLRIHLTRDVEAREIKPLRQTFPGRRRGGCGYQLGLALAENLFAV